MRKLLLLLSTLFVIDSNASLQTDIDSLLKGTSQPANSGIVIQNTKTGEIIYQRNADYRYIPASVEKLLTASAALMFLGEDFRYQTQLLSNGKDYVIKFSGDPELTHDDLNDLLKTLSNQGIKRIAGKVKLDANAFDDIPYAPGWSWDDLSYYYAAPLTAMIVDKNTFTLTVTPAEKVGVRPKLLTPISKKIVSFDNRVRTTKFYNKYCPLVIDGNRQNEFTLSGCVDQAGKVQSNQLALRNPVSYVGDIVKQSLAKNQVEYDGKVSLSKSTQSYRAIATHFSRPLNEMITQMLKESDNQIADSLLKTIGHQYYHTAGSWSNGVEAIKAILAKPSGIDFSSVSIQDGSGLSRYNLLAPNDLIHLLDYIYSQKSLREIVINALPIGNVDGTLVDRMSFPDSKAVRAKTGSMSGVSSLSGYLYTKHLGVLSFAIMTNGFVGDSQSFQDMQDKICSYLINH